MAEPKAAVSFSEAGDRVAAYPADWAADVVSADGRAVRIRPIRPEDNEKVLQLYERLSPESMYLRFFSPVPAPFALQTERLTQVDQDEHVVIVAESGDEVVAMARYDRLPGDTAEVAFVVDDAHQSRGLGTLLLEHLAAIGRGQGLRQFVATTLPQNRQMLAVFRERGIRGHEPLRAGHDRSVLLDRHDGRVARSATGAGAPRRGRVDRGAAHTVVDRPDRSEPPAGDDRPRDPAQPPRWRVHRSRLSREPESARDIGRPGVHHDRRRPR